MIIFNYTAYKSSVSNFIAPSLGMDALDSDKQLLSAGGKTAARDIVQFVA